MAFIQVKCEHCGGVSQVDAEDVYMGSESCFCEHCGTRLNLKALNLKDLPPKAEIREFEIESGYLGAYRGEASRIKVPDGVRVIGNGAFRDMAFIEEIILPDSVVSIGYGAFRGCRSLSRMDIPDSVTSIGYKAFYACTSLVEIQVPPGVNGIAGAFRNCTSLRKVSLPSGLKDLRDAFSGCSALCRIEIPPGVRDLDGTFRGCTSLEGVVIPEGVKTLDGTFAGCCSLREITIPSSVMSMDQDLFYGCSSLEHVTYNGNALNDAVEHPFRDTAIKTFTSCTLGPDDVGFMLSDCSDREEYNRMKYFNRMRYREEHRLCFICGGEMNLSGKCQVCGRSR